jgi:hypothetical protein
VVAERTLAPCGPSRTTARRRERDETDVADGRLVAVDLGLRTGLAVFGPEGRLERHASRHFRNRSALRAGADALLREIDDLEVLVVEGDRTLAVAWERHVARRGARTLTVTPEVWRARLLHPRERRDTRTAKAAADTLARSAIEHLGDAAPTSLRHDAAEAVLIGLWGVLEVGWLSELPPALDPRRR